MDVLRELCEELTSQKHQQEVRRVLKEYEQKIERLRKCASEIHMTLQPTVGGTSKNKLVLLHKSSYASGKKNERKPLAKSKLLLFIMFRLHFSPSSSIYHFDSFLGGPWTHLRMEEGMATVRCHLQDQIISHQLKRCYMGIMYVRSKPNEKDHMYNNPLLINYWF